MGPFPHDAPAATISADNPMGTDGFEFVEYAHPQPEQLHALFKLMGYAQVARHKTRKITVYRQGDINYLVNEASGTHGFNFVAAHGPCVGGLSTCAVARRGTCRHSFRPENPRCSRDQGNRRQSPVFRRPLRGEGFGLRRRIRLARCKEPATGRRRAVLSRSPHPQRPSRPHGRLDRLL